MVGPPLGRPATAACAPSAAHLRTGVAQPLQALKLDGESAREAAVLASLHAALQYAVTGAVQFHSIQCVVLCVFTLHCCRGRGTAEQKAQRQGWHAQLSDALPAGDKAKWAAVGWVDPRLESHATQVGQRVPKGARGAGAGLAWCRRGSADLGAAGPGSLERASTISLARRWKH